MDQRKIFAFALTIATAAAACGGERSTNPGDDEPTGPSVRAVAGANQRDTVLTQLAQALIVEVRGSNGAPLAGTIVRFEALPPTALARSTQPAVYVCHTPVPICNENAPEAGRLSIDTTDTKGQASTSVRFGTFAGTVLVAASVPALTLADTSSFVVSPGAVKRISFTVRDSTVYIGGSYRFGPSARDNYDNVVDGAAINYTLIGSGAVLENGDTFRGMAFGRTGAVVRIGPVTDTAWVTVPPRGTLAVFDVGSPSGVAKVELDGSGYRLIGQTDDTYYGTYPTWTSNGHVIFESGDVFSERMYVADTLGSRQRVTSASTITRGEIFGAASSDGWIYFSAAGSSLDYGTGIWRVNTPGTDPTRVGPNPAGNANAWKVSPAPDGTQLAYSDVNRGGLSVIDIATGMPRAVVAQADMPRWSPLGDWIVFNADTTLYRIQPNGVGRTRVGPIRFYHPRADWSPDGLWLIARTRTNLELINVATAETLPLGWSSRFIRPAWKR
jgi:hypothetical protein